MSESGGNEIADYEDAKETEKSKKTSDSAYEMLGQSSLKLHCKPHIVFQHVVERKFDALAKDLSNYFSV